MRLFATRIGLSRVVLGLLCAMATVVASVHAQVAGRNVNMVTGGTFPGGDPYLQKQNEPSLAMSTRNPCHLLAGANDYRAVNLPGLPDEEEAGDAWVGWYESTDCGSTWYSTLVPGYAQDASPAGIASPVKGLSAGADPVVRSGAAGTFYYLFIAFNRGTNVGKLALARAIDHNDRETFVDANKQSISLDGTSNPRRALSPIHYTGTTEIARGSSGQFIDKPSLAVFPAATGTCVMDGETVPATNVYTAWTEFVGNGSGNQRSKVYFARSADCGRTLAGPATKLSEGYALGQGTVIAVNPNNPNDIYVVWRQLRTDRVKDALLFARSTDGGRTFSKADTVPGFGEGQFAPFDQNTTSTARGSSTTTFRTVAYPALAFADDGYLYMAVSQVPTGPTGTLGGVQARITITRTAAGSWEMPREAAGGPGADGQQFMPALAYAAGKLQLVWYDVRFDEAETHRGDRLIDEKRALATVPRIRRTIDLMGAQASIGSPSAWPPVFQPFGVAQPDYNEVVNGVRPMRGPRVSQYLIGDPHPNSVQGAGPRQLQFNRANLMLYGGGTIPFMGDYIDIAGIPFVFDQASHRWLVNGQSNKDDVSLGSFQAAWTDNRDARVGKATTGAGGQLNYASAATLPPNVTVNDVSCPVDPATQKHVDNTATRDANVYTSRITQDFSLSLPTNSKPSNTPGVVRAFAVQLANATDAKATFALKITDSNASLSRLTFDGTAGDDPIPVCKLTPLAPAVHAITINVLPKSSATRTVYVNCGGSPTRRVVVTATRLSPGLPASASVVINADPSSPPAKNANGAALTLETHNPDAENPDAQNPDAENPAAQNPDAENPDAENPDAENPDAENPDAENPDAENPDAENPDAENPDAENPDAENANFQDVTTDITNTGNTTSGYQVVVNTADATAGYKFLLLANRVYSTPTSINCHLAKQNSNQQLFAIPLTGADLNTATFLDENSDDVRNATILIRPGETIRIKLRIAWDSAQVTKPFCQPGQCHDKLEFRTRALAPNTGATTPEEDQVAPTSTLVGTVWDFLGDAGGGPDLTSATLTAVQGNLNISVRYAPGTFNATSTIVNLVLDIDENPATGSPGVDSGCSNDSSIMGTDFIINTGGASYGSNVFVYKYVNQSAVGRSCNTYASPSNVGTRTVVPDGVDFVVPLSALGNDSGRLKFKVLSATTIPTAACPTCSTSVQDYMPNVGSAPGQVPTPILLLLLLAGR